MPGPKYVKIREVIVDPLSIFPGPARYEREIACESDYMKGRGFTKGRRGYSTTDLGKTPGPGKYKTKYIGNYHGNAIIGTAPRVSAELIEETPGPGNYRLNETLSDYRGMIASTGRVNL